MGTLIKCLVLGLGAAAMGGDGPGLLVVPFPRPHTIDAALANLTVGDESTEAFQARLEAAEEENHV
jgi:hypothetical protein